MSHRDWGNPPIQSTQAASSDPSTSTLIAELNSSNGLIGGLYEVRWAVGASTGALFRLEHALSTGLGSTAIRDQAMVFTGSNQTSEFVFNYKLEAGDRLRVLTNSSFTGSVAAKISAEQFT
jgi:hypothetical protein